MGILEKSGSWYAYNGERLGQGRDNVRLYLREHPDVAKEIEERLRGAEIEAPAETDQKDLLEENMKDILDDDFLNDDDMDEL